MALLVVGPAPADHHHLVDDHADGEEDGEDHPEAPLCPATVTVYLGPRPGDHLCQVIILCQSYTIEIHPTTYAGGQEGSKFQP